MRYLLFLLLVLPLQAPAHGDEPHGPHVAALPVSAYFSSEAVSDKYEVLVKYGELSPGDHAHLKLFIADAHTNAPIDAAVSVTIADLNAKVAVEKLEPGIYELEAAFPKKQAYRLNVSINGPQGPDLIQLGAIEAGKALPKPAGEAGDTHGHWGYLLVGLLGGALLSGLVLLIYQRRMKRRSVAGMLLLLLLPAGAARVRAHEGEAHGPAKAGGAPSDAFRVEKETQFLFKLLTAEVSGGAFRRSVQVIGTVVPAPGGSAVIQSPQAGRIISLNVQPGQAVSKGQLLATVEQQVDAGTQIDIITQRNNVNAEYQAAKVQYERLKAIEDIAARKDVTEARARYQAAQENKRLLEANTGGRAGSTRMVRLTAPIAGVVGTFNYAMGAVVNAGETLFEITNLNHVYIQAQVFSADVPALAGATDFTTRSATAANPADYTLTLVSQPQTVNTGNQSQQVLFRLQQPAGQLKIGENVTVTIKTGQTAAGIVVPQEAVTDVNGKPAVFIKDRAEQFRISFVATGQKDPSQAVILRGVTEGEKIVTRNLYELKMIYLNQ